MDQIIITNCDLGKKVSYEYNAFIEESGIDISDMKNPFADARIMITFLKWLENWKINIDKTRIHTALHDSNLLE